MSTERLDRIIEEVKLLTADDRRLLLRELLELHERLSRPERPARQAGSLKGTVKYMAPDFDAPVDDFPVE